MIDRNKVIDGLFTCTRPIVCRYCPYRGEGECVKHMMSDAHDLLKADQATLISQKDRIESLERIVDHLKGTIHENVLYLRRLKNESLSQG